MRFPIPLFPLPLWATIGLCCSLPVQTLDQELDREGFLHPRLLQVHCTMALDYFALDARDTLRYLQRQIIESCRSKWIAFLWERQVKKQFPHLTWNRFLDRLYSPKQQRFLYRYYQKAIDRIAVPYWEWREAGEKSIVAILQLHLKKGWDRRKIPFRLLHRGLMTQAYR